MKLWGLKIKGITVEWLNFSFIRKYNILNLNAANDITLKYVKQNLPEIKKMRPNLPI